jgi:phosphoribosylanthranilate isomerase
MTRKPIIYVSRISNLSDARYCAGMGVDMVGFVVDPSNADYVSPARYQEMVGWIAGPARVLEIADGVNIKEIIETYRPELIHTSLALAEKNVFGGAPLIVEVEHTQYSNAMPQLYSLVNVKYVIVTGYNEGAAITLPAGFDVLIETKSSIHPAAKVLEQSGAAGLALQGTTETTPGLKDYDHLSKILEELDNS